jgi:broad specificity phosphatase PhoE
MAIPTTTRTLLLVRHGETLWNAERRWQGQTDVPLSDTGREQARLLGARLGRLWSTGALPAPMLTLTSDLSRARETAALVLENAGLTVPTEELEELRERFFGSWEGKTADEVGFPPGSGERAPDAEGYDSVYERMGRAVETLWEREGETTLIVGHGGSLRTLLAHALGLGPDGVRRFALANTSLSIATFTGPTFLESSGKLLRLNDTAHLENTYASK